MPAKRTAAATEAGGKAPASVVIQGKKFKLPKKLSHRLIPALENGSVTELADVLFGDQAEDYWELDLSIEESSEQLAQICKKLGLDLGE